MVQSHASLIKTHPTASEASQRRASCTMQAWLAQQQQQMRASSNITKALMPKTASLEQAGGLHRMVLRGHSGPIHKVLLAPGGTDVVTGIPFSPKLS